MTAYALIETTHENGYVFDAEVAVWHSSKSGDDVKQAYKELYPETKFWDGETHVRSNCIHSLYADCYKVTKRITFHDSHPLKAN